MVSIVFPADQLHALSVQMQRAQKELGKSAKDACQWAGVSVCRSLAASTKQSAKLRPIVANPHPDAKRDMRRAKWGVERYKADGSKKFVPIYKTAQFGMVRFVDKSGAQWYKRRFSSAKWEEIQGIPGSEEEKLIPSIKNSPKRVIGRRGLAQKVWRWAASHIISGGVAQVEGVPDVASVTILQSGGETGIRVRNKLRYAEKAFQGGRRNVDFAMQRAADHMLNRIDATLAKIKNNVEQAGARS